MPDNQFITTRTPGSLTSTYDLAAHVAAENPHPQYLLYEDWVASSGEITDNMLQVHIKDPDAHGDTYVKPSALNNYYTKTEIDNNIYTKTEIDNNIYTKAEVDELLKGVGSTGITLHHDPFTDADPTHAASMQAANAVYLYVREHETQFAQTATKTKHLDSEGLELYAHRVHEHSSSETWLNGFALKNHKHQWTDITDVPNFDDLYALKSHTHDGYVTHMELEMVGVYPSTVIGVSDSETDGSLIPFNFNDETTQGNTSISPTVMSTASNKPDITTPGTVSFLSVVTEITTEDNYDVDPMVYGERSCSQTLTTDGGIYYRIGHRVSGSLTTGQEELSLWTWSAWQPIGGGAKDIFEVFYSVTTEVPRGAFPLWTGETLTNCRTLYPTFYQKALDYQASGKIRVVNVSTYDNEVATYGECGAFVIDTNTGSIRLPKITRFVSSLDGVSDIGITKNDQILAHIHTTPNGELYVRPDTIGGGGGGDHWHHNDNGTNITGSTGGSENLPKHVRLALYIQVYNTVTASAITDLDARVGVLEQNAIMFARHDFTSGSWKQNASTQLYEYTFNTNHFTASHIYMIETGGSVLVDESVEVHIVGSTEAGDIDRYVKLVAPQAFTGYIITLG